jgi:hypothetical protein
VSTNAGEEFLNAEGLGDVVIRTGIEGFDLGALVVADGEDDDGRGEADTNGAGDFDAGHPGIMRSVTTRSGDHSR